MKLGRGALITLALILFTIWFLRFKTSQIDLPPQPVKVVINFELQTEPKIDAQFQKFRIDRIQVKTSRFPEYHIGDKLVVSGVLDHNQMVFPKISRLTPESARPGLKQALLEARANLIGKINRFLPSPQSSLVAGILLGQDAITGDFLDHLRKTGLVHIVVVSGQNISILAGMILATLSPILSRRKTLLVASVAIVLYSFMVGAQPPVVRAAIMGILAFSAFYFGRQVWSLWVLALTSILMVLVDPTLPFNVSFQLSLAATFGVVEIAPKLESVFLKLPKIFAQNLAVSFSAYLMTLPIIIYHFGQASLVAPIANLLVIWLVAPILSLGIVMILVGSIIPPLGQTVGWILWVPTTYFVSVADSFANLPFASFSLGKGVWQLAFGYFILLTLALKQTIFKEHD